MSTHPKERQPWNLQAKDFTKKRTYAAQDWRFQMFFEYLRLSPSYALALDCGSEVELAVRLRDAQRGAQVWQTRTDMGNVYEVLYRDWWLDRGLTFFGVHARRPKVELIHRNSPIDDDQLLISASQREIAAFLTRPYQQQGRPDSVLLSIPLGQKPSTTLRQLKKLLSEIKTVPPVVPEVTYPLESNKMRYRRLLAGVRLVYHRSARPDDELWRVASRARISHTHQLDPAAQKKDVNNAEARRILTIMASRLLHDSMVVAENAAMGRFPSLTPIAFEKPDYEAMGKRLYAMRKWEKARRAEMKALNPK
jgi:hypothetical protein